MLRMEFLYRLLDWIWGVPLLSIISFVSLYLLVLSKGAPFQYFLLAWKIALGKKSLEPATEKGLHNSEEPEVKSEGQISQLRALMNAIASTVGMGNIAGVAVAIEQGGPGAVFWMWLAGFVGMNTKFFECTLSVMYRGKDVHGEVQGGPMYYIHHAFPSKWARVLAFIFTMGAMLGTMALFQASQLSDYVAEQFSVSKYITACLVFVLLMYILKGGLKRLSNWTVVLVPFMCWGYILLGLYIISQHLDQVLPVFQLIFRSAFFPESFAGAFAGYSVAYIFRIGLQRAAFSNEAGMGTAPMAHGNAKTSEPLSEGFVAMLGPFIDTVLICTLTALILLISTPYDHLLQRTEINWVAWVFQEHYGDAGIYLLFMMIFLFSFTTMIGMANYNEKCWNYLFGKTFLKNRNIFILFFCTTLFIGSIRSAKLAVGLIDLGFGIMAYVNFITIVILAPRVAQRLNAFRSKAH